LGMADGAPVLEVRDLRVHFDSQRGRVFALNGVDLTLNRAEITGLVGETGSGKSVTARAVLRLLESNGTIAGGHVLLEGEDLLAKTEAQMRAVRGREVSMVFQDARAALNPVFSIGHQLERVAMVHEGLGGAAARARAIALLSRVGISDPERRVGQVPHQLSGGMCQRVMIAMALICSPKLIILDEPTTGLDVTVQAEILDILRELVAETRAAALLITHDLGVVAETCRRIAVMYAGRVVEEGSVEDLLTDPLHPYTADLYRSRLDVEGEVGAISSIPGSVPDLRVPPAGCAYYGRCSFKSEACLDEPAMVGNKPGHRARCFHSDRLRAARTASEAPR
jgi:peptide/nickel transport system ATP-binding protein